MSTNWGKFLADLQKKHKVSQRQVAHDSSINRGTLRSFRRGDHSINVEKLQTVLALFGYELTAVKVSEPIIKPMGPPWDARFCKEPGPLITLPKKPGA